MDVFNFITLIILSIATIRKIIADNFNIPINKKWSWILYDKKEIPYCYQLNKIQIEKKSLKYNSNLLLSFIILLGNHTKHFNNDVYCDRDKKIPLKYMVNTLEASHNEYELQIMTDLLKKAYLRNASSNFNNHVDFIISIKGGNVLLVNNLIKNLGNEILHITFNRNLFYDSIGVTDSDDHDRTFGNEIKFENLNELIRLSKTNRPNRPLNGMIIDCSYSSGDGIIQCIENFQKIIQCENLNVNKSLTVLTLYSHVNKDISDKILQLQSKIDCMMYLNDNIRRDLYNNIYKNSDENDKTIKAKNILKSLRKQKLIK